MSKNHFCQNWQIYPDPRAGSPLNNGNFWNDFKNHLIKIYTKTHHFAKFSRRNLPPNTFAMHSMLCRDTSGKMICTPLLNPVMLMYAHLSLLGNKMTIKKGPLLPIFSKVPFNS